MGTYLVMMRSCSKATNLCSSWFSETEEIKEVVNRPSGVSLEEQEDPPGFALLTWNRVTDADSYNLYWSDD